MEDSIEPNLMLVVPSSVEDGESSPFHPASDNPLGLSTKLFHSAASPSTREDNTSFSCFQLSGITTQSNSESSTSTVFRIYEEDECDIIPASPDVLHIDLNATPSVSGKISAPSETLPSYETSMEDNTDSGRASPELISSSTITPNQDSVSMSSTENQPDMMITSTELSKAPAATAATEHSNGDSSNIRSSSADATLLSPKSKSAAHGHLESQSTVIPRAGSTGQEDPTRVPLSREDATQLSSRPNSEPPMLSWRENADLAFDADTESYSLTNELSSSFLKKYVIDDNPTPIILTASTQAESEMCKARDSDVFKNVKVPPGGDAAVTGGDNHSKLEDVDCFLNRGAGDVLDKQAGKALESHDQSQLLMAVEESQEFTQEEIHLHLTFSQSQSQFDQPVFDEESQVMEEEQKLDLPKHDPKDKSQDPGPVSVNKNEPGARDLPRATVSPTVSTPNEASPASQNLPDTSTNESALLDVVNVSQTVTESDCSGQVNAEHEVCDGPKSVDFAVPSSKDNPDVHAADEASTASPQESAPNLSIDKSDHSLSHSEPTISSSILPDANVSRDSSVVSVSGSVCSKDISRDKCDESVASSVPLAQTDSRKVSCKVGEDGTEGIDNQPDNKTPDNANNQSDVIVAETESQEIICKDSKEGTTSERNDGQPDNKKPTSDNADNRSDAVFDRPEPTPNIPTSSCGTGPIPLKIKSQEMICKDSITSNNAGKRLHVEVKPTTNATGQVVIRESQIVAETSGSSFEQSPLSEYPKETESEQVNSATDTDSMKSTYLDDNNNNNQAGGNAVDDGSTVAALEDMETQPFGFCDSDSQELVIISDEEVSNRNSQVHEIRQPVDTPTSVPVAGQVNKDPTPSPTGITASNPDTNAASGASSQTTSDVVVLSSFDEANLTNDQRLHEEINAPNGATKRLPDTSLNGGADTRAKKNGVKEDRTNHNAYEYRSQLSQDINIKSIFVSPTNPPKVARRASGGLRKKSTPERPVPMETDANNNPGETAANSQTEDHDRSSDTLPMDDNSERSADHDMSPPRGLVYRVTKYIVKETLLNGKVIDRSTVEGKPQLFSSDPSLSSHSSNGSGYLADVSSFSRTSSDSSTQTSMGQSPGHKSQGTEPSVPRDLSGGSSSSSGSSNAFLLPGVAVHPSSKSEKRRHASRDGMQSSGVISPTLTPSTAATAASPNDVPSTSGTRRNLGLNQSPILKESRVVLTPLSFDKLSMELVASEAGTMGASTSGAIATPPTAPGINPPLSVSTPMFQSQDYTSDISSSNSPEVPLPGDPTQGSQNTSFNFDPNSSLVQDDPASPSPLAISEGIRIMAKAGTENYYYPGIIRKQDAMSGKYTVFFEDDRKERLVRESDILLIEMLPVGQEVYAQSDSEDPSDWYSAGTILSYWIDDNTKGYIIEKVDNDSQSTYVRRYSRKQVIVKQESLKTDLKILRVQPVSSPTTANVSLDNVLDGKRRSRRSTVSGSAAANPATPSPRNSRTPRSSRKRSAPDSESSGSSSCVPFPSTKKSKRAKLTFSNSSSPSASKSQSKTSKAAVTTYSQSDLFKNCGFLLTSTTGKDQPSSEFDSPPCASSQSGYDRDDIRKKIIAGNGVVAKTFTQLMACDRCQLYVISDNFCRTMNYFNALAAGISCLSYLWIDQSDVMKKQQPTQAYLLQAGYSLEQQRVVERPSFPIQPLSGLRVSLQLKEPVTWNTLLSIAGCHTVSMSRQDAKKNACPLSCDVLVADSSCSSGLLGRAKSLDIPVVTAEWVIQSLINSEKLPFDGQPQYKHTSHA